MDESAVRRRQRQVRAAVAASRCARELTEERGLDGFTMDELAERAGVSRRTLFNWFASKTDAVLGPAPVLPDDIPADVLATYLAGGPHGDLLDDLAAFAVAVLDSYVAEADLDTEDLGRAHRLLGTEPRLLAASQARFERLTADMLEQTTKREGEAFDAHRARVALAAMMSLFDVAVAEQLADPEDRPLQHHLLTAVGTLRSLVTPTPPQES